MLFRSLDAGRPPTAATLGWMGSTVVRHRHGWYVHAHAQAGAHGHVFAPPLSTVDAPAHDHDHGHAHTHRHGHSHALVDPSIVRSHEGIRAVAMSLAVLGLTAGIQVVIFVLSGSVALLADLIHNFGDAVTAVPLGIAFFLRSGRGERWAGLAVVLAIFFSACAALYETVARLIHPQGLSHLWVLALAGVVGFLGNEVAAQIRLRAGRRLQSPALVADGNHARVDGFVSLGVIGSAIAVAVGAEIGDPIIGLLITLVILKITWDSFITVRTSRGAWDERAS